MGCRGDVLSHQGHTYIESGVVAGLNQLIANAAHTSHKITLCLIALYQGNRFLHRGSRVDQNRYARNVSCYQGNAQLTDHSIRKVSHIGLFVGLCAVHIFHGLDHLRGQGGGDSGLEYVVQTLLAGHHLFDSAFQGCLHLS